MNADTQGLCPGRQRPRQRWIGLGGAAALLLFVWVPRTQGQGYHVRNWHLEDGLPGGQVTAIAQTPDGYLWVGTPRGLARFDGVRFKVFIAGTNSGLGDSRITSLLTDGEGMLWVGTLDGNVARWQGDRFEPVAPPVPLPVDSDKQSMPDVVPINRGSFLLSDREGGLWWSVPGKGVARLQASRWTIFTPTNGLPNAAGQLVRDGEGRLWTASGTERLYCFESGRWDSRNEAVPLSNIAPPTLAPALGGGLWVADPQTWRSSNTGLVQRLVRQPDRRHAFTTLRSLPPRTEVTALHEDRSGRLWAGTLNEGLCYFDAQGRWSRFKDQGMLERGRVTCLFEDRQGNVWAGTDQNGLYRVTPQLLSVFPVPGDGSQVWSVCATRDQTVWVGTFAKGVFRFHEGEFTPVGGDWGTPPPDIDSLFEDSRTNLWAGTGRGLFQLQSGRFRRVTAPPELNRTVAVIFEDRAGSLWFGGQAVLACRRAEEFSVLPLPVAADVRALAEDGAGDLWIGTVRHGLFRLPRGEKRMVQRVEDYPERDARSLFFDRDGILWVGGEQSGLFRRGADGFEKLSTSDDLPVDTIYSFISDQKGNLWMGSGNGIIGIAAETMTAYVSGQDPPLSWEHLSLDHGLRNRSCYSKGQSSATRTSDGRLWFPNVDHLAVFDPAKERGQASPRSVLVESVLADGQELPFTKVAVLRAPSGTRRFEFHYTALDLTTPSSLRFRYKLEGMDPQWVKAGAQRVAQYSQLPPGDYEFRVLAGGSGGQWHEASRGIQLRVVPHVWERRWVQLLATVLLVSLVGGSFARWRRRRMQLKIERLEMEHRVEAERRRIARDLHDEVGSRLTRLAQLGELATSEGQSPDGIKAQVSAITSRIRELINAMSEVVWTVNPRNDSLPKVVAFLSDYTETFVGPTGIRYRLELDPEFPPLPVLAESRHHLLLAVKEALNNAVRHAAPTIIRLEIHVREGWLEVAVADDGRGFDVDQARSEGRGLANLEERMKIVRGRAEIRSQAGQGTQVTLAMALAAITDHD